MQRETQWLIHSVPRGPVHQVSIALSSLILNVSSKKALLPSGGYCKISQIIFAFYMTASSFVIVHLIFFVFSWYATVPLDISVPNSNFFFLKAFVPLCCLLSRSYLKNICGGCLLFISARSASASRKGEQFCWILHGSIKRGAQLLYYKKNIN